MSSSDGKPSGGLGSLFAFLFAPETRARVDEEYQRALAMDQEQQAMEGAARDTEPGNKPKSEERKKGKPKCWIN